MTRMRGMWGLRAWCGTEPVVFPWHRDAALGAMQGSTLRGQCMKRQIRGALAGWLGPVTVGCALVGGSCPPPCVQDSDCGDGARCGGGNCVPQGTTQQHQRYNPNAGHGTSDVFNPTSGATGTMFCAQSTQNPSGEATPAVYVMDVVLETPRRQWVTAYLEGVEVAFAVLGGPEALRAEPWDVVGLSMARPSADAVTLQSIPVPDDYRSVVRAGRATPVTNADGTQSPDLLALVVELNLPADIGVPPELVVSDKDAPTANGDPGTVRLHSIQRVGAVVLHD